MVPVEGALLFGHSDGLLRYVHLACSRLVTDHSCQCFRLLLFLLSLLVIKIALKHRQRVNFVVVILGALITILLNEVTSLFRCLLQESLPLLLKSSH